MSTAYPPSVGGAQLHAHQLAHALARAGHDPHVATVWRESRTDWLRGTTVAMPPPAAVDLVDGVPVHQLGGAPRGRGAVAAAAFYPALLTGVAATPVRGLAAGLFAPSVAAVLREVRPEVVHLTRIGRVHPYLAALEAAREAGLPVVLTPNHHAGWVRRRDRWWWWLYRRVDAVLALTDVEVDLLAAGGVDPARIHRTSVGIVGRPTPGARGDGHRVVFLGQAHPYKGIDLLADAWAEVRDAVPDATLEVLGPWHRGQRRLRDRMEGMPGVVVHGAVDEATKWRVLGGADVLAVPSAGESLGGVYLEAWAAGAVPVGADIPPVRELLTGAGRVVPRRAGALARTLVELLEAPDERRRLVAAGQRQLATDHDWDRIADRTLDVYRTVLS